ncbi:M20/M25/M40 family metallo-hydrolase [Nannocystis sp. ILAH1]|uniref:M28 family metallopeptidase n=1 Tax=unclassified Nannocystis TaxID=2627009 RepID=UPI00226E6F2E|nr:MULTISPECIES: M20/M25/M40 family metallo-hydrolase [unclassified Nannocystis]MCY0986672.1 M20/M25/M40 family metallo-hydrolase [Nannocystis sp. ILAH1]MCY1071552.1 M20/M25/M40 family metallo-hydrolase [Nannocystis sp. RBIL2]
MWPGRLFAAACLLVACGERAGVGRVTPAPDVEVAPPDPPADSSPPTSCAGEGDEAAALRCWVRLLAGPGCAGRDNGSPGGAAARAAIVAGLQAYGLEMAGETGSFEQPLPRGANVLARVPGRDPARAGEHVVLTAHYDHLGEHGGVVYPGADDNASGVAVALAVARRLAADPPARSVLLAAFDAEEPPDYRTPTMGSEHFVAHPTVAREQLVAVVCLDLLGGDLWDGHRSPLYVMGRETFARRPEPALADDPRLLVRAMHLRLVEDLPHGRQAFSDHGAFFQREIPSLFVSTGRSPHYHQPSDTPDTLKYDKMLAAIAVVEAHVRVLADMPDRPVWARDQPVRAADAAVLAELLAAGLGEGGARGTDEFTGLARARLQADLARARALAAIGREPNESEAREIVQISLRAQCLLAVDSEMPTAACLLL